MRYFFLILKHKWFFLLAAWRLNIPLWRALMHDWTKFLPSELPYYNRQFFGDQNDPQGFAEAWLHHQNHNPHHWEYWIPRSKHIRSSRTSEDAPMDMPTWAIKEMIADWLAASRAYEGFWPQKDHWPWFEKNIDKIKVSKNTRMLIEHQLMRLWP